MTPKSRTTLLQSRIFDVERRVFEHDQCAQITRDVVVHPGAVAIVPVIDDRRIVMIRNFRFTVGQNLLEIPAGTLEQGETPIECAARELEEETGYRAGSLHPLTEIYTSPGVMTEKMWLFLAHDLTKTEQNLQSDERIVVDIMEVEELRRLIREGRIQDGKTVAALATYFLQTDAHAAMPATVSSSSREETTT